MSASSSGGELRETPVNEKTARGRIGRSFREGEPRWGLLLRVRAALHDHPREEDDVDEERYALKDSVLRKSDIPLLRIPARSERGLVRWILSRK